MSHMSWNNNTKKKEKNEIILGRFHSWPKFSIYTHDRFWTRLLEGVVIIVVIIVIGDSFRSHRTIV